MRSKLTMNDAFLAEATALTGISLKPVPVLEDSA